jgi:hypothetical protein
MRESEDWLTVHGVDLDPAGVRRFSRVWKTMSERYSDDGPREAALLAAARYLAGQIDPADQGKVLARARARAEAQLAAARVIAELAIDDGAAEATTAREIGVDRMAVRKWLGKKQP